MIHHILLIKFKTDADLKQIDLLREAFLTMPHKITGVKSVEWGINNSPEMKNKGFTHCVNMVFVDESARDEYLPHPEHAALKTIFRPLLADIIVFDYSV